MLSARRAHAVIPTQDVDALRPFYEDVLGLAPHRILPGTVVYRVGEGALITVSRSGGKASGTHTQVAFTVPDVVAEVAELRGRGVTFEEYETPKTVGGVARMPAGSAAWFKDPEGNVLGLIQFDDPV